MTLKSSLFAKRCKNILKREILKTSLMLLKIRAGWITTVRSGKVATKGLASFSQDQLPPIHHIRAHKRFSREVLCLWSMGIKVRFSRAKPKHHLLRINWVQLFPNTDKSRSLQSASRMPQQCNIKTSFTESPNPSKPLQVSHSRVLSRMRQSWRHNIPPILCKTMLMFRVTPPKST